MDSEHFGGLRGGQARKESEFNKFRFPRVFLCQFQESLVKSQEVKRVDLLPVFHLRGCDSLSVATGFETPLAP